MKTKERLANLDLMKFFAIFFVVLYHTRYISNNIMNGATNESRLVFFVHCILAMCVPMFFFVNGFLLINKKLNLKKHIFKTVKFIVITFIWGALSLFVLMYIKGEMLDIFQFLFGLWKWKLGWINHLWFMGSLVCIYIVFPLIKNAFDNNRKIFNYFLIFCMIVVFGSSILNMVATVTNTLVPKSFGKISIEYVSRNWLNIFNPLGGLKAHSFAFFMLGCFFGGNKEKISEKVKKCKFINPFTLMLIFAFSTFLYAFWGYSSAHIIGKQWDVVWNGYDSIFTLINIVTVYFLFEYYKGSKKNPLSYVVRAVSQNTLGIYFMHPLLLEILRVKGVIDLPFMQNYFANIIYVLVVVLICTAVSAVLRKIPIIKNLV